ncbi:hypothetical protein GCM10007881_64060 [Mesorhizobium huakuii]|uniref:AbiU2 domain-containing protein n=1 Tax=Mesorhizobium huakuii TaxID=28104 RepID=UPI00235D1880|nr:hypothetical protein [Mesorhizobium huakuii]GLQ82883.1 hypothetical protein GCM10007881_64060 [Mesorhizobium huakuii]
MALEDSLHSFRRDTDLIGRTLGCLLRIKERASAEPKVLEQIARNGHFWNDYEFLALNTVIVGLGRIFDTHKEAHSVDRLIKDLKAGLAHFSNDAVSARKKSNSSNHSEWLEKYMKDAQELDEKDIEVIAEELMKAKDLWGKCRTMRDRVIAHSQAHPPEERSRIFASLSYDDILAVVQVLEAVESALFQAEQNGRKPNFGDSIGPQAIRAGGGMADGIIDQLLR